MFGGSRITLIMNERSSAPGSTHLSACHSALGPFPGPSALSSLASLTCHYSRVRVAEGAVSEPLVGSWVSVDKQNPFPLDHVEDTFRGIGSHPIEKRIPVLCRTPASETKPRAVQGAEVEPARLYFSAVM